MKECVGCIYAQWNRTSNGRLHPDKMGKCVHPMTDREYVASLLPAAARPYGALNLSGAWIVRDGERRNAPCPVRTEASPDA